MREGFKIYTHHRWFAVPLGGEEKEGRRFWQVLRSKAAVRRVAQLRMAAHRLAIEEGRFSGVPRANRICVVCSLSLSLSLSLSERRAAFHLVEGPPTMLLQNESWLMA